ncbi:MAG: hypothetical protein BRC56_02265 [Cyanobacteria bacterium SW_9_47_5]|nr:MAG: hypothetical protein BRC56_02265 [Cyanobacteria bacterium SW_9_47_5]PSP11351.1 MAG: hypothetical protein BRC49_08115 [Cyanobacteria bacterium SW_10_48_33]PSP24493.1 MAG: hypothetical protein BRC55_06995 [Cyanobacteria bacterium SW_8_48_13]
MQFFPQVSGHLQLATHAEQQRLESWCQELIAEALDERKKGDAKSLIERFLYQQRLYTWQDRVPVSIVHVARFTPNGVGISGVYTPPPYRSKGYASACVAALSQSLLNLGYKSCFLITDLSNPTSNQIYQKIGYQPVGDACDYWFED